MTTRPSANATASPVPAGLRGVFAQKGLWLMRSTKRRLKTFFVQDGSLRTLSIFRSFVNQWLHFIEAPVSTWRFGKLALLGNCYPSGLLRFDRQLPLIRPCMPVRPCSVPHVALHAWCWHHSGAGFLTECSISAAWYLPFCTAWALLWVTPASS